MSFYAVAVGRRVGIYKDWAEAIGHVFGYSANSLKKFSTYQEAEAFMPDGDEDVAEPTKKRGRDEKKDAADELSADSPPCQRRKVDQQQDGIYVFVASYREDSSIGIACVFPDHPDWDVARKLDAPDLTSSHARFVAVLEAIKRLELEDPGHDNDVTVLTVDRELVDAMEACETSGWNAVVSEEEDVINRILEAKQGRPVNWVCLSDSTMDSMNWAPKWSDLAYRKAFEAAKEAN
ncbi:RNA-DNA hybrid ribonuclease [Phytophthora boehmeriae]|uniref:ribonuclease H n=1 Tax=Phytophthora boehmeriae TaxID=109152 RepID=A0A8T1VBH4_9STRA|nr:RNA-DNA hybrid ribonuclease [Phytophthora boehmeriae]